MRTEPDHGFQYVVVRGIVIPDGVPRIEGRLIAAVYLQNIGVKGMLVQCGELEPALAGVGDVQRCAGRGFNVQAQIVVVLIADGRHGGDGGAVAGDGGGEIRGAQRLHDLPLAFVQLTEKALERIGYAQHRRNGSHQHHASHAAEGAHPAGPLIFLNFIHRQLLDPAEAGGVVLRQRYAVILKSVHQVVDIVLHAVPPFSDTSWYGPSRSRKTFSFSRPRRSLDLTVDSLSPISREMSPILWQ